MRSAVFAPPRWLRNPHLQTVLGTSPLRRRIGEARLAAQHATTTPHIVDAGEGVRLSGLHDAPADGTSKGLALLLHGWEGSVDSSYMRLTAAALLARGWSTFRLNFRDHGDSHHLNEAIFHSGRIDEVRAAVDVARRFPAQRTVAAGYSLGGNFALRLALRAPAAGLRLERVAAVCPVLDPAHTMDAMDRGVGVYRRYFERKWRDSLLRKRELYPHLRHLDDATLGQRLREITRSLVEGHTDYGTLDGYFDRYTIAGDRLAALAVPAEILTAADDPVIPVADFDRLVTAPGTRLTITAHGGHCGFVRNARLDGFAEHWVAEVLDTRAAA